MMMLDAVTVVVAVGTPPRHVPFYSRTEVWIGSAILIAVLLALLVGLLFARHPLVRERRWRMRRRQRDRRHPRPS
ncbi:hypothetical protein [Nocardia sp. NPDC051570]|uniref:hypothetical protein n=1 Tax=Nocardia sp. NPDC051570 TaxID=3364324 RepID=UPI0037A006E6